MKKSSNTENGKRTPSFKTALESLAKSINDLNTINKLTPEEFETMKNIKNNLVQKFMNENFQI